MLADLTLVNCYDQESMSKKKRDRLMLMSAKNNLRGLAFFGIKERMNDSQVLFEKFFNFKYFLILKYFLYVLFRFTKSLADWNISKSANVKPTIQQIEFIKKLNSLDIQLYKFAIKLFEKRMALININ